MVAQDIPFIYHPELEGVARERRWYMNGVSWANIVYLFNILTVIGQCNQQTVYFFAVAIDPAVHNTLPMEIVDACAITIRLYLVL